MYVVTGGAGFIGSNIAAVGGTHAPARCRLRPFGNGEKWRNIAKRDLHDIIDPDRLFDFLESQAGNIKAVVHMGAVSATTETDVQLIWKPMFDFPESLDLVRPAPDAFIYASSAATYGDGARFKDGFARDHLRTLRPLNAYGWSKHLFDRRVPSARPGSRPPQWAGLKFSTSTDPTSCTRASKIRRRAPFSSGLAKPAKLFNPTTGITKTVANAGTLSGSAIATTWSCG